MRHRAFIIATVVAWGELLGSRLALGDAFEVVGFAADGEEAVSDLLMLPAPPDVVVIDVHAPGALGAAARLVGRGGTTRLLAVGLDDDPSEVVSWATAGATGLVARNTSVGDLLQTLAAVMSGQAHCSPSLAGTLLRGFERSNRAVSAGGAPARLTGREQQVALLISEGLTNKEIASRLHIESGTVKSHVHSVIRKLGVSRRVQVPAKMRGVLPTADWVAAAPASNGASSLGRDGEGIGDTAPLRGSAAAGARLS